MKNNYTKEMLEQVVSSNKTWADVCRAVGIKPATGAQTHLQRKVRAMGIDTSHFLGLGWSKGRKLSKKRSLESYLVKNSNITSSKLRDRLIISGIKEHRCELCQETKWRGLPIPLELDHINSDHWDNRLENLQIICPNCHAQETKNRINVGVAEW